MLRVSSSRRKRISAASHAGVISTTSVTRSDSPRGRASLPRGGALSDVDGRADVDAVVELDHVGDRHAYAAVRGGRAERGDVVGAVDAGTVVDAHPARLQRVLGHATRDHL